MKQFQWSQLLWLIPGIGILWISAYLPLNYLRKQIFWTKTEAQIIEQTVREIGGEADIYYKMEFTDKLGKVYRIEPDDDDTFTAGSDTQHILIYYDPSNPADFELVNPGFYLIVIFLPFGLLCTYMALADFSSTGENIKK